jgi:hypothetical protein
LVAARLRTVIATGSPQVESGLLYLNCDPNTPIPSGYKREQALAEGCTLTNYIP